MSLNTIPHEIFNIILNFLEFSNEDLTINQIIKTVKNYYNINLIDKSCKDYLNYYKLNLQDLKDINYLVKKYYVLINEYEYDLEYDKSIKPKNKLDNYKTTGYPILIDILSSGINLPLIRRTLDYFDDKIITDIFLCLKYFPNSIYSNYGRLRCRYLVGPFYFACLNENIPIDIIKLLINNKLSIDETLLLNGYKIKALNDLDDISKSRYNNIINMLINNNLFTSLENNIL